jgi:hypothetical protein
MADKKKEIKVVTVLDSKKYTPIGVLKKCCVNVCNGNIDAGGNGPS